MIALSLAALVLTAHGRALDELSSLAGQEVPAVAAVRRPREVGRVIPPKMVSAYLGMTPKGLAAVYYDVRDPQAKPAAQAVLESFDRDYAALAGPEWFAFAPPRERFIVYVTREQRGGGHYGCDSGKFIVGSGKAADYGGSEAGGPFFAPAFLAGELAEYFEAYKDNGWDCAQTNGEALSRVAAFALHPELGAFPGYGGMARAWWGGGHPDHVTDNSATDQDELADACGVAFMNFLHGRLGQSWRRIIEAGGESLGETYQRLTGRSGREGFESLIEEWRTNLAEEKNL